MRITLLSLLLAVSCAAPAPASVERAAAPAGDDGGFAVLLREAVVADEGGGALPTVRPGEVYPSPGTADNGFLIVCRDADGVARLALLPTRDQWGRVTARDAAHDIALAPQTVAVQAIAALRPGRLVLPEGSRLPILKRDEEVFTVRYAFGMLERTLAIAAQDARYEAPPEPERDPARLRELALTARLAEVRAEQERLSARLETVMADSQRVSMMLQELSRTEIENSETQAQIAMHESVYGALTAAAPGHDDIRSGLQNEVTRLTAAQAQATAELEVARLGTGTLRSLHTQVANAESALEQALTDVSAEEAALEVLLTHYRDPEVRKEIENVRRVVAQVKAENEQVNRQSEQMLVVGWLSARLEAVLGENALLKQRLAELGEQYEKLKQDLDAAQAMLEGTPPAADEPPPPAP